MEDDAVFHRSSQCADLPTTGSIVHRSNHVVILDVLSNPKLLLVVELFYFFPCWGRRRRVGVEVWCSDQ